MRKILEMNRAIEENFHLKKTQSNSKSFNMSRLTGIMRAVSGITLDEIKDSTPRSHLILGTFTGYIVANRSLQILRATSLLCGSLMLALAIKNKGECCLNLMKYSKLDLTNIMEYIKRNESISVGLIAGFLIGFSFS